MTDALLPRLALLAAAAVWQAARSRHYFHMLQLNSYRNERYAAWLSKNAPRLLFFAGLPGAVRRMSWDGAGPVLEVIGGGQPRGLCGSGLLDALALLLELGAVDQSGRLLPPDEAPRGLAPWLERDQNGNGVFFFTPDRSLFLTAGDLRALQLAKGAVAAGIEVLLRRAGLSADELDGLYLAGGLGSSLNPQSALRIGMFPPQLAGKITALGNTALAGAGEALLSERARAALFDIARRCTYVELSGDADFSRAFPEHLLFD